MLFRSLQEIDAKNWLFKQARNATATACDTCKDGTSPVQGVTADQQCLIGIISTDVRNPNILDIAL